MQWGPLVLTSRSGTGNRPICSNGRNCPYDTRGVRFVALNLAHRIEEVRSRIADAASRSGRSSDDVTLIAVSKMVNRAVVDEAYALGLRQFGENRVQDSIAKYTTPLPGDARLHMIGQLQSNKSLAAIRLFDVIQSVDRSSLITALEKHADIKRYIERCPFGSQRRRRSAKGRLPAFPGRRLDPVHSGFTQSELAWLHDHGSVHGDR